LPPPYSISPKALGYFSLIAPRQDKSFIMKWNKNLKPLSGFKNNDAALGVKVPRAKKNPKSFENF
jgi:hypothetical protein